MTKKTYADFLRERYPEIVPLAEYYAAIGAGDGYGTAKADLDGESVLASNLFAYALRSEVGMPDDHAWAQRILSGDINVEDETLLAQAAQAVEYLQQCKVDIGRLTPLIRAIQAQVVANVAALLDQGPGSHACRCRRAGARTGNWSKWTRTAPTARKSPGCTRCYPPAALHRRVVSKRQVQRTGSEPGPNGRDGCNQKGMPSNSGTAGRYRRFFNHALSFLMPVCDGPMDTDGARPRGEAPPAALPSPRTREY